MRDWALLKWFKASEFKHPDQVDWSMLQRLDKTREEAGIPFVITSDYRPGNSGAHGRGYAVDIRAHASIDRLKIVDAARKMGFSRIGVYNRHIHLDTDPILPIGMWGGISE